MIGLLIPGLADANQRVPALLAWPCRDAIHCRQSALYRPCVFQPGANYSFSLPGGTAWGRFGASATVRLFAEFAGSKLTLNATAIFYDPKHTCGVFTFTRWVDAKGDGGRLVRTGHSCFFVPGIP